MSLSLTHVSMHLHLRVTASAAFLIVVIKHPKEGTKRRRNHFGSWSEMAQCHGWQGVVAGRACHCDRQGIRELAISP